MYCLFLFIQSISFPKEAPTTAFLRSPVLLGLLATRNIGIQPYNLILYTAKWYFLVR